MIKAYHRVSSNSVYEEILDAGAILPAAFRVDPDQAIEICQRELDGIGHQNHEARRGLERLIDERVSEIASIQARDGIRPSKTSPTMLFCVDFLAGDFMNVFLTPGGFTNAAMARAWPVTGFAFDALELIRRGAEYRSEDLLFHFRNVVSQALRSDFGEYGAYEFLKLGLEEEHRKALNDNDALEALQAFENTSHNPTGHREKHWPANAEVVWRGPLPIDLAKEFWVDKKIVEAGVA